MPQKDEQVQFHPLDLNAAACPFDALASLTATCPLSRQSHGQLSDVTLVASYDLVSEVYHRRGEFSNRYGHSIARNPGPTFDSDNLFTLDGDAHRRVRRILVTALNPHLVELATPYITDLARTVVSEIADDGHTDLRESWATRIPGKAVAHMIGVPEHDHEMFFKWTMEKMETLARMSQGRATIDELHAVEKPFKDYMDQLLRLRRETAQPGDDILTRLLQVEDEDGFALADREIIANVVFLLNAGNQTTANLLTNLVEQLMRTNQWKRVRQDRSLVPTAIEESLRLTPPIQYGVRRPTSATQIGEHDVGAGEVLVLSHLAAGRDPQAWGSDAAEFDLDRSNENKHLGFGMGPHSCVGSAVARRIALVAMNELLDRFESLSLAPDFVWRRQDYWTSLGMVSLKVVW